MAATATATAALDLPHLRQLPRLAHRPNFPHGLHVLLIDADYKARREAESQLREYNYSVTPCSCLTEAAQHLSALPPQSDADRNEAAASCDVNVDLVLADVHCLQQKCPELKVVVAAARSVPLVLMGSAGGAPKEVMLGIRLGAVDFLEKPLSPLKLKTIWQHLVRRALAPPHPPAGRKAAPASCSPSPSPSPSPPPEPSPSSEHSGSHAEGPGAGAHSHGSHGSDGSRGESGSNASTSEQAALRAGESEAEMMDMETCSWQDAMGAIDALAVSGEAGGSGADEPVACARSRPQPQRYRAGRAPGQSHSGSGGVSGPQPCMGQPAGRLPPLPEGVPGVAWGLPTTPLQFCPKAPLGGMPPGPMGWPPMGAGGGMMGPAMFPMALMGPSPSASVASASACGSLGLGHSCLGLSGCGGSELSLSGLDMQRADSAPLQALSGLSNLSGLSGPGEGLMLPLAAPAAAPVSQRSSLDRSCLFAGLEGEEDGAAAAPIGLTLKKSDSLLDFIAETLKHVDDSYLC